jgi:hypothetical protein
VPSPADPSNPPHRKFRATHDFCSGSSPAPSFSAPMSALAECGHCRVRRRCRAGKKKRRDRHRKRPPPPASRASGPLRRFSEHPNRRSGEKNRLTYAGGSNAHSLFDGDDQGLLDVGELLDLVSLGLLEVGRALAFGHGAPGLKPRCARPPASGTVAHGQVIHLATPSIAFAVI